MDSSIWPLLFLLTIAVLPVLGVAAFVAGALIRWQAAAKLTVLGATLTFCLRAASQWLLQATPAAGWVESETWGLVCITPLALAGCLTLGMALSQAWSIGPRALIPLGLLVVLTPVIGTLEDANKGLARGYFSSHDEATDADLADYFRRHFAEFESLRSAVPPPSAIDNTPTRVLARYTPEIEQLSIALTISNVKWEPHSKYGVEDESQLWLVLKRPVGAKWMRGYAYAIDPQERLEASLTGASAHQTDYYKPLGGNWYLIGLL